RMAAALQRAGRGEARVADCDRRRAEELGVLPGHRGADAGHRPFLSQEHVRASSEGRAGWRSISLEGRATAHARQGGVCGELRALPFEQNVAAAGARARPGGLCGQGLPPMLEPVLGMDGDARVQDEDAGDRPATDFLDDNYLSNEVRVPVTLLQTNACSPLATNALA